MAESTGNRNHYREIAAAVKKMLVYPDGKERAKELLDHWRICYKKRPAMQDELRALYLAVER